MTHPLTRLLHPPALAPSRLSRTLGWVSIALGAAELLAPRRLSGSMAEQPHGRLLGSFGAREIVSGLGLLSGRNTGLWMWGRVAGDVIDMAALGRAACNRANPHRGRATLALAAVAGVAAVDLLCARALTHTPRKRAPVRDYSQRSGFGKPLAEIRGAARNRPAGNNGQSQSQTQAPGHAQPAPAPAQPGAPLT